MSIVFNFGSLGASDPGVKQVIGLLGKAGCTVITTAADPKATKVSGIETKTVTMTLADSQNIGLSLKSTGDIWRVTLNGKAIPVRNQDNIPDAIQEIAGRAQANSAKYQKQLAAKKVALPASIRTSRTNLLKALTERRDSLVAEVKGKRERLQAITGGAAA